MNYVKIETCSIANGTGFRVVLWCSGCGHHCKGCHNPETWDRYCGKPFDEDAKKLLYELLSKPYIKGLTLSGGDPMFQPNVKEVIELVKDLKNDMPDKDIWMYTGYTFEELCRDVDRKKILPYIDVVIDGKFILEQRDISLPFRGSPNQRIIDVPATLKENKIIWKNVY